MAGGFVQNRTFRWWKGGRATSSLVMCLPSTVGASIPTWAAKYEGFAVYDSTSEVIKYGTSAAWVTLATATAVSLDGAYNNDTGERTIAVDGGDVVFDLEDKTNDYCVTINNSSDGTIAAGLVIDAEDASSVFTDGISLITTAGAITDGIDASDAGITNAINVGGNVIIGTTAVINFTNFDVSAAGVVVCASNCTVGGDLAVTGSITAGTFDYGSDGDGIDITFNTSTAGDNVLWDESAKTMLFTDTEIHMIDDDVINFGTGSATGTGDFGIYSDGSHLYLAANADVAGQTIYFGDDTNDLDMIWESNTNAALITWDSSALFVYVDGIDYNFGDNDLCTFGDGASSNGDFKIYSDGTHLYLTAVANSDGATLYIGDDTHAVDIIWEGTTDADQVFFDHGSDKVTFTDIAMVQTESATGTSSLDITSACTTVNAVEINVSGAVGSGTAALAILGGGATGTGSSLLRIDQAAGTPNAASAMMILDGAAKDMIGISADVDSTGDCYVFHCGGVTGSGDSVFSITSDGTIAASAAGLLEVLFTGDDANEPILISASGTGNGINSGGVYVATSSDGTSCWHLNLVDAKADATGVVCRSYQNSATEAADDAIFTWRFCGNDDAGTANITEYARLEAEIMTVTDGQEDGRFVLSCAANDGTMTQMCIVSPRAAGAESQVSIGNGSGNSYITTPGESLTIDTNGSTNSGAIVITAAANGDISLTPNGTGAVIADNLLPKYQSRAYSSATTNATSIAADDMLLVCTTAGDVLTVTLPAATGTGRRLIILFAVDDGNNVTVAVTGNDTFFYTADGGSADNGDNSIALADAGDYVILVDALTDYWLIEKNGGGVLSGA